MTARIYPPQNDRQMLRPGNYTRIFVHFHLLTNLTSRIQHAWATVIDYPKGIRKRDQIAENLGKEQIHLIFYIQEQYLLINKKRVLSHLQSNSKPIQI